MTNKTSMNSITKTAGYIKLIRSVDSNHTSVIELNILPGEKMPWHYHTLFSETFTVVKGNLQVLLTPDLSLRKSFEFITQKTKYYGYLKQAPITVDPKGGKILSIAGGNHRYWFRAGKQWRIFNY